MEGTLLLAFSAFWTKLAIGIPVGILAGAAVAAFVAVSLPVVVGVIVAKCAAVLAGVVVGIVVGMAMAGMIPGGEKGTDPLKDSQVVEVEPELHSLEFRFPDENLSYACDIVTDGKTQEIRSDRGHFERDVRAHLRTLPTEGVKYELQIDGKFGQTQKENFRTWTKEILQ